MWGLARNPGTSSRAGTVPDAIRDNEYALGPGGVDVLVVSPEHKVLRCPFWGPTAVPVEVAAEAVGPGLWPSPSGTRLLTNEALGLGLWELKTGKRLGATLGLPAVQWASDDRHVLVTMDGLLYVLRRPP